MPGQKAAIYVRVSTHWQIDKDSLPMQREELSNYCKYALDVSSFEIFEDAGYSAKNTERPAYQQMMARLRTGEFSHLVVWKIDRISRNLVDFATMYEEIKRLGVAFASKNEQFDTSSAMGEAMLKIILVFAELERKVTSERVTATMLSRASNGEWNGGVVPFGYSYSRPDKSFSVDSQEAAVVRMVFDLYEREKSLLAVAKTINGKGFRTRRGSAWSPTTVLTVLRSPFYVGTYRYNYRYESTPENSKNDTKPESDWVVIENHHEAIIDKEQWDRANSLLTRNRRDEGGGTSYNRGNVHIFAGLLRCSHCGSVLGAMSDRERSDGWKPSAYLCSRRRRFSDCTNKYITDVTLGPFALNYIANMMKAQRSFGASTSIETLEKKLLRGKAISEVAHVEGAGLRELYCMLRREKTPDVAYETPGGFGGRGQSQPQELELLVSEKRRSERALARLQSLFLYGDSAISEKDYLVERKRMGDELAAIDARIDFLEKDRSSQIAMTDEDFISKASYFILTQGLTDKREVDYAKIVRAADPRTIKEFLNSVVANFCIKDGRVDSIRFKNGMEHRFVYKDEE